MCCATSRQRAWPPSSASLNALRRRSSLLESLAGLGAEVRAAMASSGSALEQDVEGAWVDGQLYVVQSRPQV